MPFGDDDKSLVLEIQSNAQAAINDLRTLTENVAKLGGAGEAAKKGTDALNSGFTALQAKIVAAHSAIGLVQQGWAVATGVVQKLSNATIGSARAFAEYGQQLKNVSTQLGISAQFYQVLEARLTRLGLGTEAARLSLFTFNRALEEARQGAGNAAEVIQRLNVNVDRTRGIEEIYLDVAKAITALGSSTERAQAAQALFGRSGGQQLVVFGELADGAKEFETRLKSLGVIMDQGMVRAATRADVALSEMNEAMKGLSTQWQHAMAEVFAPAIENASKRLEEFAAEVNTNRAQTESFIKVMGTLALAIIGPAGAVAAVATLIKTLHALRAAFIGIQLAAGPLGWLTAMIGLLGSAAAAWGLFADKVDAAADKLERAKGIVKANKYDKFWETGDEPNWPLPGLPASDPRNLEDPRDFGIAGSASPSTARDTDAQIQRTRQAQQALEQALAAAAIAQAERTRGTIAGIQETLKWKQYQIEQERLFAVEDAQRIADSTARTQEIASINAASAKAQTAAEKEAGVERLQAAYALGQQLSQQTAEQQEALGAQTIALQRIQAQSQLELQQITYAQFYAKEREFAAQEHQLALARNQAAQDLARAGTAELKVALDERLVLEREHAVKLAQIDAEEASAARESERNALSLRNAVRAVEIEAFGTPAQQRIEGLRQQMEDMITRLGEAGLVGEIERVRKAFGRLIEEATPGFVHLGRVISQSIGGGIADALAGTANADDVLSGLQDSFRQSFANAFSAALQEKLHFDAALNVNFLRDIPAMASKGATSIANTFSNLFAYIGSGSSTGPRVDVNEWAATSAGTIAYTPGLLSGALPAGGAILSSGEEGSGPFTAGDYGMSTIGGTSAFGAPTAGSPGGSGDGISTAGAGGGAAMGGMYLAFVMMAIGAITEGIKSYKANKYRLDLSEDDLRNKAYGDAVAGAFDAVGFGGIGELLGGAAEKSPAWLQEVLTPFVSPWFMKQLGLFKQPSRGKQAKKLISEAFQDLPSTNFPIYQHDVKSGGYDAMRVKGFELPGTEAEAALFEAMGYGREISFEQNEAENRRQQAIADQLGYTGGRPFDSTVSDLAGVNAAIGKYEQPGVSALRTGPVLGLAQVLVGGVPGADAQAVQFAANTITNSLRTSGMSEKEARGEIRALFEDFGHTFSTSTLDLRTQGLENNIKSMEQMKASIDGVVEAFRDDLPPGLDAAALSMEYLNEVEGKIVFNARAYNKEVEHLTQIYQARVSTMSTGFAEGVNAALDSLLAVHRLAKAALETTPMQDFALQSSGTPMIAQIVAAVAGGERQFKGSMMAAFGQALRQDLITSAYDRITDRDSEGFENSPWAKLTSGTLNMAELPATLSALWAQVNKEIRAAVIPLAALDEYFASMAENTEEMGVNLGDTVGMIENMTESALRNALQALLVTAEEAEAARRSLEEQVMDREQRLRVLDVSIEQARLFGDEIRAAELEMERQTLQALQLNQQAALSTSELFKQGIKEGMQQAVVEAIIAAMVSTGGIQHALIPFMEARQDLADAINSGDVAAIAAARTALDAAIASTQGAISSLALDVESIVNLLSGTDLFGHIDTGQQFGVFGRLDWSRIGEIATAASSAGGGGAMGLGGGTVVQVNITGNYIGDQATADHLVSQMERSLLTRLKFNDAMGH